MLFACSVLICSACRSGNTNITSNTNARHTLKITDSTPKIMFLNYAIKKAHNGKKHVTFLSSKTVKGSLKQGFKNTEAPNTPEDLICTQRDKHKNIITHQFIDNPLEQRIEYLDETKAFKRALIALDSSNFSVRLQLHPKTTHITIDHKMIQQPLASIKITDL